MLSYGFIKYSNEISRKKYLLHFGLNMYSPKESDLFPILVSIYCKQFYQTDAPECITWEQSQTETKRDTFYQKAGLRTL